VLARVKRVEIEMGDAVHAKDHGLAIDHKLLDAVFQGGLSTRSTHIRTNARLAEGRVGAQRRILGFSPFSDSIGRRSSVSAIAGPH
jgi:hypothetical protein